jgi:hypothetical protein
VILSFFYLILLPWKIQYILTRFIQRAEAFSSAAACGGGGREVAFLQAGSRANLCF